MSGKCEKTKLIEGVIIKTSMKRTLMVGGAVATIGIATLGSAGLAHAATSPSESNPGQSLIDTIAKKFNLNKDEVKKVFDEDHTAREANREQKMKDRLDQAVKDGTLTQDQADKLIAKLKEMRTTRDADREAMKDKTQAERKALMQAERDAYQKWLSDNKIPEEFGAPMGMGGGRGHHGDMKPDDTDAAAPDTTTN